jgi:hypothetical protein
LTNLSQDTLNITTHSTLPDFRKVPERIEHSCLLPHRLM